MAGTCSIGTNDRPEEAYRQYKARTGSLPAGYHTAIDAMERYLMYFGRHEG